MNSLPAPEAVLVDLFNFINRKLSPTDAGDWICDHSMRFAREFISTHGLDADQLIGWLEAQGAYCDCSVLTEVAIWWDWDGPEDDDEDEDDPDEDLPFVRTQLRSRLWLAKTKNYAH